ncbi:MAG: hypothetical protein CFH01_02006 [Alphaproteobacteria bacterium MarineAlpha2_Bin1]|nr:MAG: hypothetical protein CFH01_02006 [Alphaproteobacteria bacterium MarineAlpha2_Bin1]
MRHSNPRRSKSNRTNGKRSYNNGQNRSFESNGAGAKLRGTASQVFEKYIALARDASSSGDRISAENFFQHAEHYFRIQNLIPPEKKSKEVEKPDDEENNTQKTTDSEKSMSSDDLNLINGDVKKEVSPEIYEKEENSKPRQRKKRNPSNLKNTQAPERDSIS